MNEPAPLSYGQLSVWRDVRDLRRDRWHEANTRVVWPLPDGHGHGVAEVEGAVLALAERHESLRTVYDLTDTFAPSQRVLPHLAGPDSAVVECPPARFDTLLAELAAEPFDLRHAPGWRSRVVTREGRPRAVVLVQHHIGADGWSNGILEADFRAALRLPGRAAERPPAATPRALAAWQRSEGRQARRAALTSYWERIYDLTTAAVGQAAAAAGAGAGTTTAGTAAYQYSARSRQAYAAARRHADRLSVPVSSVVLAAFAWNATRAAGPGTPVAQLMSSNRFIAPWNGVVSSMNQWTAAELDPAGDDFGAYARHVHTRGLLAYRHGMYDVDRGDALRDAVRAGRDPYQATFAFNFLTDGPPPPGDADADAAGAVRETPFSLIGHPCYLRATDEGGESLHLRLRTMGLPDALTRDLLSKTIARLTDAGT